MLAATAAIAAGAGGYLASQASDDLQDSLEVLPGDPEEIEKRRDRARLLAYGTDAAAGTALLFTGTAAVLWLLRSDGDARSPGEAATGLQVSFGPSSLGLRGKF